MQVKIQAVIVQKNKIKWKNGFYEALSRSKKILPWRDTPLFFRIKKYGIRSRMVKCLESHIKSIKKKKVIEKLQQLLSGKDLDFSKKIL